MAFDAEEVDFGHSLAVWPAPPQKIVVKPALALLVGQLTILTKLIGDGGRGSGGRWRFAGLVVVEFVFLVFGGVVVGIGVVAGVLVLVLIVRLLVFGFIGLGLAGTGFLPESFPVTGVDGVGKVLHSLEC